jgi:hypothetical protein
MLLETIAPADPDGKKMLSCGADGKLKRMVSQVNDPKNKIEVVEDANATGEVAQVYAEWRANPVASRCRVS